MFSTTSYIYLGLYVLTILFVTFFLIGVSYVVSRKDYYHEKVSAYECGFEPFHGIRRPVNINFYNIALLFLLFDVEIVLILPGAGAFASMFSGQWWLLIFVNLLWIGYIYELQSDSLYIVR